MSHPPSPALLSTDDLDPADRALLLAARDARDNAHAPISRFQVGAALRAPGGAVVLGCNVENWILPVSACAEQVAIWAGVAQGHRGYDTVAVITETNPPAAPCGKCRQLLHDWGVKRVLMGNLDGDVRVMPLSVLLPEPFVYDGPPANGGGASGGAGA